MPKSFRNKIKRENVFKLDWMLLSMVLGLTIFGVVMVGNASVVEAYRDFGDKLYYFRLQAQWAILGLLAFIFFSFFDYQRLKKIAVLLMVLTFICLVLVLLPGLGSSVLGARRWLGFGIFKFQPAELAKLSLSLYLATFFSSKKETLPFIALLGLLVFLVMLEPDLGTTIIIVASSLMVYFVSGAPIIYFGFVSISGLILGMILILFSPYRRSRLTTFLSPTDDPTGASYHVRQALIAIGSGGIWGVGLGQSRQKFEYLPMASTDSIFAVIAEELGFIGAVAIIIVFLLLIWRGLTIAQKAKDDFGRYLAVGIISWIGFQTFINLGAMVAVVPLTGVPLPFISYGGSSLTLILTALGILHNIKRQSMHI